MNGKQNSENVEVLSTGLSNEHTNSVHVADPGGGGRGFRNPLSYDLIPMVELIVLS